MRQSVSGAGDFCVLPSLLDPALLSQWLAKPCFPSDLGALHRPPWTRVLVNLVFGPLQ